MATATGAEATRQDLVLQPGANLRFTVDVGQTALGAATAQMEIKSRPRFPVVLLELSTANSRLSIDATTGIITGDVDAADTVPIEENGNYDLLITYEDGSIDKLQTGSVTLRRPVTVT